MTSLLWEIQWTFWIDMAVRFFVITAKACQFCPFIWANRFTITRLIWYKLIQNYKNRKAAKGRCTNIDLGRLPKCVGLTSSTTSWCCLRAVICLFNNKQRVLLYFCHIFLPMYHVTFLHDMISLSCIWRTSCWLGWLILNNVLLELILA